MRKIKMNYSSKQHKIARDLKGMGWNIHKTKKGFYHAKQNNKLQYRTKDPQEIIVLLTNYYRYFLLGYENSEFYHNVIGDRFSDCITEEFLENFNDIAEGLEIFYYSTLTSGSGLDIPEERLHTSDWLFAIPSWDLMTYVPSLNPFKRWFGGLNLCLFVKAINYRSIIASSIPPIRFSLEGDKKYSLSEDIDLFSKYYGVPAFPNLDNKNIGLVVFSGINREDEIRLKLEDLKTGRDLRICLAIH